MKTKNPATNTPPLASERGFALVVTLSLMILLTLIAVALLGLSSIALRSGSQGSATAEARANARLALMIALGELQKELGPDTRISSESALLDTDAATEKMDGVVRSRWLASHNAWGDWLNNTYTSPDIKTGSAKISDTYTKGRDRMFRRWLLSLPLNMETNLQAPAAPGDSDDKNWVSLVDSGTLGSSLTSDTSDRRTRAYKTQIGTKGTYAWWISPENHKAKASLVGQPRTLAASQWEESKGDTAEVGVGVLNGYASLYNPTAPGSKIVTTNTLRNVPIDKDRVDERFFDLTTSSRGVIASVRGTPKRDLSLLFEMDSSRLTAPYKFTPGSDIVEPSVRPMSPDLAGRAQLLNRQFQSWTNMRHYYRMYRSSANDFTSGGLGGSGNITWSGVKPTTNLVGSTNHTTVGSSAGGSSWDGSNSYWRVPLLAKITFIYSLVAEPSKTTGKFDCFHVYSPVFTFWNPYNVEMTVPNDSIEYLTSAYKSWPNTGEFWLGSTRMKTTDDLGAFGQFGYSQGVITRCKLTSGNGSAIVFNPGEFRVFSLSSSVTNGTDSAAAKLVPGFNPQAISGEKKLYGTYAPGENPGITVMFSHNYWGGNINNGNTCGSLCMIGQAPTGSMPINYAVDWLDKSQRLTPMTPPGTANVARWVFDGRPLPVAFCQLVVKGVSQFNYESIKSSNAPPYNWAQDWRCRNWIQAPPYYFGAGMYISEDKTIAHTQRLDCPYSIFFGPTSMAEIPKVVAQNGPLSYLGSGSSPYEVITAAPSLELPSAPIASLAGFSGMRINPGWTRADKIGVNSSGQKIFFEQGYGGSGVTSTGQESLYCADTKRVNYLSGVTGPGVGNSFLHPMLSRTDVYSYFNNSVSQDMPDRSKPDTTNSNDSKAYNDFWDHVFLLNDTLWDDYFVSSLADQTRPSGNGARTLAQNLKQLVDGKDLSNMRYRYYSGGKSSAAVTTELQANDGYLKAAKYLMVDGMFNVNSTSVAAWQALFTGIRERQLVYRDNNGSLKTIAVPSGKRIALSRFDTETSDKEMDDAGTGVTMPNGSPGWSGVRYLDDAQLLKLAQECVKQVKQRGPFLNFSEFINRRLSNDNLGLMGALQSAIDYDDAAPDTKSINYRFKKSASLMIRASDLGTNSFKTPEAVNGSRLAGIPGYIIQSDLLKPIANTMSVRDDTFRIRTYGEAKDANGNTTATAYCEAIVQRMPEYCDPANDPDVSARTLSAAGVFSDNALLTTQNRRFGRKFQVVSFRWLNKNEV